MKMFVGVATIALLLGACQSNPAGLAEGAVPMPASEIREMYAGKTMMREGGLGNYTAADGSYATVTFSSRLNRPISGVGTWTATDGKMCAQADFQNDGNLATSCWTHWRAGNELYARYDGTTWTGGSTTPSGVYKVDTTRFRNGNIIAADVSRYRIQQ